MKLLIILIVAVFLTSLSFIKKVCQFFGQVNRYNTIIVFLTFWGILSGLIYANEVVIKVDSLNSLVSSFYSAYQEEKFKIVDLRNNFRDLSSGGCELVVSLKRNPIPFSLFVWYHSDLLSPYTFYSVSQNVLTIKFPINSKEIMLNVPDNRYLVVRYQ